MEVVILKLAGREVSNMTRVVVRLITKDPEKKLISKVPERVVERQLRVKTMVLTSRVME